MKAFTLHREDDGVAVLTFDLPGEKVNKLTTAVMDELGHLLDDLASDERLKALVITSGKADTFIAGADIAEIRDITDPGRGEELSRRGQAVFRKIEELPVPTVAAIHGACLGGGLELALACDHRIISNDAKTILGLPEIKIGIIPGFGGTQRLPRLVGLINSLGVILTGKNVHPKKAKRIGLADAVTHRELLLTVAVETARRSAGRDRFRTVRARRPLAVRLLESTSLTRRIIFRRARRNVLAETRGNYPAPLAALEAVRAGYDGSADSGYVREAQLLGGLVTTDVSKNLVHVFYLNEALKRNHTAPFAGKRTAVIGAGIMGGGISQLFAERGLPVRMKDISTPAVGAGFAAAARIFSKRQKKGILDRLQARDGMDRISGATDWSGFRAIDIAVEAVVENMDVKKAVLREFEAAAGAEAIYASNTSSLSITELATAAQRPERVVGMHFFNPVEKMPLVEVVRGEQTSPSVIDAIVALSRKIGKLPVVVNDGPGFLVNRILMPYLGEALRMLEEGASIEAIDGALMHFGMPMGAFILLDEIGIDVAYKVAEILRAGLGERIGASPLLASLYADRHLGRKNRKGFYRYEDGRRAGPDLSVMHRLGSGNRDVPFSSEEITDRAVLLMLKEAALCLEEGIIDRPDLLDAALIFGIGFPPFRGGLLRYADAEGPKSVVEKLDSLADRYGKRFRPPHSLFEMSRDEFITQVVR